MWLATLHGLFLLLVFFFYLHLLKNFSNLHSICKCRLHHSLLCSFFFFFFEVFRLAKWPPEQGDHHTTHDRYWSWRDPDLSIMMSKLFSYMSTGCSVKCYIKHSQASQCTRLPPDGSRETETRQIVAPRARGRSAATSQPLCVLQLRRAGVGFLPRQPASSLAPPPASLLHVIAEGCRRFN